MSIRLIQNTDDFPNLTLEDQYDPSNNQTQASGDTNLLEVLDDYLLDLLLATSALGFVMNAFSYGIIGKITKRGAPRDLIRALSVADEAYLVWFLVEEGGKRVLGVNLATMTSSACSIARFYRNCVIIASTYTVLVVTVDRFLSVRMMAWYRNNPSHRHARVAIAVVWVLCAAYAVPAYMFGMVFPDVDRCSVVDNPSILALAYSMSYTILLDSLLPLTVIITLNTMIGLELYRRRKLTNTKKTSSITKMLFFISMEFAVLKVYFLGVASLANYMIRTQHVEPSLMRLLRLMAFSSHVFRCSSNFVIYCLTGRSFRSSIVNIFCQGGVSSKT